MKFDQIFQGHDARSLPPFQQRRKFDPQDSHIPRQRLLLQGELRPQKGYKSTCELRNLVRCTNCPCSAPRSRIHSDPFPEQHIPLRHVIELRLQFSFSVVRKFHSWSSFHHHHKRFLFIDRLWASYNAAGMQGDGGDSNT